MKTKNQIQTALQKILVVVASFVLISLTVNAQDFWNDFLSVNTLEEIVFVHADIFEELVTDRSSEDLYSDRFLNSYEIEIENELELEDWMIMESNFTKTTFIMEQINEGSMELENWMFNENLFEVPVFFSKTLFKTEDEQSLNLESWMLNEQTWNF